MIWVIVTILLTALAITGAVVFIIWVLGFVKAMDDAWGYSLKSQRKGRRWRIRRK